MKNLNELGVQEMDIREMRRTDGGFLLGFVAAFGLGYTIGRWIGGKPLWKTN